jgi:hypothetical protein
MSIHELKGGSVKPELELRSVAVVPTELNRFAWS